MRLKKEAILFILAFLILTLLLVGNPRNMIFTGSIISWSMSQGTTEHKERSGSDHHQGHFGNTQGHSALQDRHPVFTGSNMYMYWPPVLSGMTRPGKKFDVDIRLAKEIKEMSKHFFVLNEQTVDKFVMVMASSTNHFDESIDCVASAQHHFPGKKLFYYDLGLRNYQIDMVKSWKWVEYRQFDFSKYPKYFEENLRMVGWKPIIIQEVLAKYGAVLWMDASIRLLTNDFSLVYEAVKQNGGIMLFKNTKHSIFAATHKGTYDYLPTNRTRQMKTPMCIATSMLVYNTKTMFYNVLWWFFLCALQESCQAPMEKTMCDFDIENKWGTFANCHKWDQSSLNVLLSNFYGYRHHKYLADEELLIVERWPTHRHKVQSYEQS